MCLTHSMNSIMKAGKCSISISERWTMRLQGNRLYKGGSRNLDQNLHLLHYCCHLLHSSQTLREQDVQTMSACLQIFLHSSFYHFWSSVTLPDLHVREQISCLCVRTPSRYSVNIQVHNHRPVKLALVSRVMWHTTCLQVEGRTGVDSDREDWRT